MPKIVDHNQRRLAFAEAAFRVIARRGLEQVTVREIAREAGFTTGALVHYFKSKDQVLIQASSYIGIVVRNRMQVLEKSRKGLATLKQVVYESMPLTPEMRGAWNVWLGLWQRSSESREVGNLMQMRYFEWEERISMLVEEAQKAGELSPEINPKEAALTIISIVDGIGARVCLTGANLSAAQQKRIVDGFIDNLPTPKPAQARVSQPARQPNGKAAPKPRHTNGKRSPA